MGQSEHLSRVRATRRAKRRPAKRIYHPGPPIADETGLLGRRAFARQRSEFIGRLIAIAARRPSPQRGRV